MNWQGIRHYVYLVLVLAQPILLYYGISTEQEITLWVSAITTLFGLGTAAAYSSSKVAVIKVD